MNLYARHALALSVIVLASIDPAYSQDSPTMPTVNNPIDEKFVLSRVSGSTNPEGIPDYYGIRAFGSAIGAIATQPDTMISDFALMIGIDAEQLVVLEAILSEGQRQEEQFRATRKSQLCSQPDFVKNVAARTNAPALLAKLDSYDDAIYAYVEEDFEREVSSRLGSATHSYLMQWIDRNIKKNINEVKVDHYNRDIALGRDPFSRIVKFCN